METVCSFKCECKLYRFCFVNFYTSFFIPDGEQVEMVQDEVRGRFGVGVNCQESFIVDEVAGDGVGRGGLVRGEEIK